MDNKKTSTIIGIGISIVLCGLMVYLTAITPKMTQAEKEEAQIFFDMCCEGKACTDTYYDNTTDECVLTMCAQKLIMKQEGCRYPADHTLRSNRTAFV